MLKAVIIDDEPDCVKLLALQLKLYCSNVQVVGEATDSSEGLLMIKNLQPDIVFLDIEMPLMNGFQLLEAISDIRFHIVFVTAYDKFAVRAFRFSALDYLLKPVNCSDLKMTVNRAASINRPVKSQLALLKHQLNEKENSFPVKIALPFQNGVVFAETTHVLFCQSDNNYTRFHMQDGRIHIIAKTLGDIQDILEEGNFLRVHRQYIVNLDHIKKFVRGESNYLVMSNDQSIPVARAQKEKLKQRFGWL